MNSRYRWQKTKEKRFIFRCLFVQQRMSMIPFIKFAKSSLAMKRSILVKQPARSCIVIITVRTKSKWGIITFFVVTKILDEKKMKQVKCGLFKSTIWSNTWFLEKKWTETHAEHKSLYYLCIQTQSDVGETQEINCLKGISPGIGIVKK